MPSFILKLTFKTLCFQVCERKGGRQIQGGQVEKLTVSETSGLENNIAPLLQDLPGVVASNYEKKEAGRAASSSARKYIICVYIYMYIYINT